MGKKGFGAKGKGGEKKGKQSFKFKGKKNNKIPKRKPTFDVNARLVVRNLSFKTTEETIKKHFEPFGKIAEIKLLKRPNGDLVGCGFVQFEDLKDAKQAVSKTNSQPFLGRQIEVDWAVARKLYAPPGNTKNKEAPVAAEEDEVKSEPESALDDQSYPVKHEAPLKPVQEEKKFSKGRQPEDREENDSTIDPKNVRKARLIIRNISFKATQESLAKHFAPYGVVQDTVLLKKPNGDLVGCGFVQFDNVKSATKAILHTNAKPFLNRPIHVDWAIAKNKYMSFITQQKDEEELLKNDVKSEPESGDEDDDKNDVKVETDDDDASVKEESDDEDGSKDGSDDDDEEEDSASDKDDDSEGDDDDDEDENDDEDDDNVSQAEETDPNKLKVSANDAEDGKTIFLKNVPFSVGNDELQEFVRQFGETYYSLVCMDKLTEHSKGTAFVRFQNKEDADIFLSAGSSRLTLDGQILEAYPAMFRDRIQGKNSKTKKQPKDSRNLYLIKEGVILANSKAALGVSASDMAKRLSLEQNKSQMLRNLNRFISRYRLTIHNVPSHYGDGELRKVCLEMANVKPYCLKECRVMKHLKGPLDASGKHMSKGYGFVMFTKHEDALACLRRMNNNPSLFDKNNRPIVSFSVEDKVVINARKKRLEKSQIKNPLSKSYVPSEDTNEDKSSQFNKNKPNKPQANGGRKRKGQVDEVQQESPNKKPKFDKKQWKKDKRNNQNNDGSNQNNDRNNQNYDRNNQNYDRNNQNYDRNNQNNNRNNRNNDRNSSTDKIKTDHIHGGDYSGETGKPGNTRMRNNFRLRTEAATHRENVKNERKKQKASKRSQDIRTREKIRQPKQKQNTNVKTKFKQSTQIKDEKSFTDLVNKYKSKLTPGNSTQKIKSKWYEAT